MLAHLASLKPEILLTKMFILIPSKMQKKRKIHHLGKAGLAMQKLHVVPGTTLHRGTTAAEELVHYRAEIQLEPTLCPNMSEGKFLPPVHPSLKNPWELTGNLLFSE